MLTLIYILSVTWEYKYIKLMLLDIFVIYCAYLFSYLLFVFLPRLSGSS